MLRVERALWKPEFIKRSAEVLSFLDSGILMEDQEITNLINSQDSGSKILIPFIAEQGFTAGTLGGSGVDIVATDIVRKQINAAIAFVNNHFTEKNYNREVKSGINDLDAAHDLKDRMEGKELMHRMISTLKGAIANNKTLGAEFTAVISDNLTDFNYNMVVDAQTLAGDTMDDFVAILVHTSVYGQILKNDNASVTNVFDSEMNKEVELYKGMRLLKSNKMPNDGTTVTSVLLKPGAFVYGNKDLEIPVDNTEDAKADGGQGTQGIVFRDAFLLSLNGIDWLGANVASPVGNPSVTELEDAANWNAEVEAGNSPYVAIESKA